MNRVGMLMRHARRLEAASGATPELFWTLVLAEEYHREEIRWLRASVRTS